MQLQTPLNKVCMSHVVGRGTFIFKRIREINNLYYEEGADTLYLHYNGRWRTGTVNEKGEFTGWFKDEETIAAALAKIKLTPEEVEYHEYPLKDGF